MLGYMLVNRVRKPINTKKYVCSFTLSCVFGFLVFEIFFIFEESRHIFRTHVSSALGDFFSILATFLVVGRYFLRV